MKKLPTLLITTAIITLGGLLIINPASAETIVTKNITINTTWTAANSPYVLTKTIEVESNNILSIEPGVVIQMPGGYDAMFILKGKIHASGTAEDKITFDGGGNSTIFNARNSKTSAFLDCSYCEIKNGTALWKGGFGYFSIKNSVIENFTQSSSIESPTNDVYLEYNTFINIGGFTIEQGGTNKVYIRYNLFDAKNPDLASYDDFLIQDTASYDDSNTIIEYNTFKNISGIALKLPGGYGVAALSAPNNYWGATDPAVIDAMIYDKNDNANSAGYIAYTPILTAPHPDTPGAIQDTSGQAQDNDGESGETPPDEIPVDETPIDEDEANNADETEGSSPVETPTDQTETKINEFIAEEKTLVTIIDNNLSARISGRILLQVQNHGEAWYVNPKNQKKYYLANGDEAYRIMRYLSVGITNADLDKVITDKNFAKKHSGKIFLQVEAHGEAYYIDINGNAHYLKDGATAYTIMRDLGLGITNSNVRKIEVGEI